MSRRVGMERCPNCGTLNARSCACPKIKPPAKLPQPKPIENIKPVEEPVVEPELPIETTTPFKIKPIIDHKEPTVEETIIEDNPDEENIEFRKTEFCKEVSFHENAVFNKDITVMGSITTINQSIINEDVDLSALPEAKIYLAKINPRDRDLVRIKDLEGFRNTIQDSIREHYPDATVIASIEDIEIEPIQTKIEKNLYQDLVDQIELLKEEIRLMKSESTEPPLFDSIKNGNDREIELDDIDKMSLKERLEFRKKNAKW